MKCFVDKINHQLPLKDVHSTVQAHEIIGIINIELTYHNTSPTIIEAAFTFPVDVKWHFK